MNLQNIHSILIHNRAPCVASVINPGSDSLEYRGVIVSDAVGMSFA